MFRFPRLSVIIRALCALAAASAATLNARSFQEKYALAADRDAVIKDLIPGTDDYFFYSVLYHQTQGDQAKAAALLKQWEEASSGPNGRRDILKNRAELLAYDKDPARTLTWLREKLSLEFNHQRQTEEARAELVSTLDPALISFAAFEQKAISGTEALENVTDAGLYRLTQPVEKWKLTEIRALLSRLKRPDFPGLVAIIDRELKEKDGAFGKFPIHTLLTSDQLADLQKRRPALLNDETFTAAVMTRLRPLEFEDPDRDPAVRGAWLERLWAYAATLPPKANPLRANLLYHLLAHDERQGKFDPQRLIAYLKLPRPVAYVNPRYKEDRNIWKFPAALDFDPSAYTGTQPVGNDEPLVRRLVIRYLTTENSDALAQLVSSDWLNSALAEAKLTTGAPQPQKWMSLLSPEALQSLRDRTDIEFDPASRPAWQPDDVVMLDVWLKNVPSLLVRVYEINTANVHRTGEEVNTGLDLDGLTANQEQKRDFKDAPILRSKQTFSFPELNGKRGVWIIEFIGNGKASRALIRKGGLRSIVRQTSAGTAVTVLDEKLQPVPKAFAMIGPKQFKADEKGLILLPLSEKPGEQKIVIDDGSGFTALEEIELQGEKYTLTAGFHVPRESLLPGNKATLLIRPRLQSNGRPVLLESLEKAKVTIASQTLDGTPASVVIPVEKFAEDKETTVEFAVPDRLASLMFTLSGEVKSTLTGAPVRLKAEGGREINTITTSGQVSDLFLSQNNGQWVLQELGLNGEPRPDREVTLWIYRPEFSLGVEIPMKTDATGSIVLGALEGASTVSAACADGMEREFPLPQPLHTLPALIHLRAGEALRFPWSHGRAPLAGEVALVRQTGPTSQASPITLLPAPAPANGYLTWKDLSAGTYTLHAADEEYTVRMAPGDPVEGHALTAASTAQLSAYRPLSVTGFAEGEVKLPDGKGDPVLVFHLGGSGAETRVHILASRFLPDVNPYTLFGDTDALEALGVFVSVPPFFGGVSTQPSQYLSSRNIGSEYRYVLERRAAARFAGNMLAKPGLLINPWEIAVTTMEKEQLEDLEKATNEPLLPKAESPDPAAPPVSGTPLAGQRKPQAQTMGGGPPLFPDLSFLATPAPALLNLRPAKDGTVVIPRAALGDRQYVRVLAIDRESSAVRDFSLPAAALPPRDLRLARQLNPAQHFSRQNRVTVLEKDAAFRFDDALAAQFQAIGHLGAVQQLFFNLTQNPLLNEFSWLLEWKTFDDAKKRALYSQYACHELHFFLQRKDRAFFDAVVQPFLASKRERTFMDDYLLGSDLTRYLASWHYGRLNALERILLAERIKEEVTTTRRMAEDWMNIQPVDRGRDMFLFETALRGRALVTDQSGAEGMVAATFSVEEFSVTDGKAEGKELAGAVDGWRNHRGTQPAPNAWYREKRSGKAPDSGIVQFSPPDRWDDYTELSVDLNRPGRPQGEELKRLFEQGHNYYGLGQFNEAQANFNKMLAIDPNNTAARRGLERTQREAGDYLKSGRDETRLRMLGDVDNLWVTAVPGTAKAPIPADPFATGGDGESSEAPISFKLNNILVDRLSFSEANVGDVLSYLRKKSVENDQLENDPDKKGVNFVNRVSEGAKPVTLDLQNVKLIDAIKAVTEAAGVRYDIQSNAVVTVAAGTGSSSLTTRVFKVPTDFLAGRTVPTAGEPSADPFALPADDPTNPALKSRPNAKSVLETLGVTFPEGSTVSFDAESGRLIVRSTSDQLDLVETLAEGMSSRGETGDFDNGFGFVPDAAYLARFKARGGDGTTRLFRQQDPTKVWAEQQYYRLPLEAQTAGLVPMNRFWRDYAVWDGKGTFVSTNVADAAGSFAEMVLALAVLDLPFPPEFKSGKMDTKDNVLTLTPASRSVLFHQDILPAEVNKGGTPLLVSQNFYREGDRYIEQAGEKTDKFVSAEFLTGTVYGCQVVVTNPSSSRQRLDVLFQIPAGALPVKATRRVQSLPVQLEPFRTATLDFHFYFPQPGKFAQFPVHISRNTKTAASAAAFNFNVVGKPTINDPASWDYVSQHGTDKEVLNFLEQHNLYFLDLDKMLWRLKDADFFRRAIALLKGRHHYDDGVWSYSALHNVQPWLSEYLQESPLSIGCGPAFESELLTVNPVEQKTYQHLEYSPLVNARAHPLGSEHRILNDKFHAQWNSLLQVLAFRTTLTAEDTLAVAGYMATQDRIEEALAFFARIDRAAVAEKLQYEYLRAWLAMCQEDTATARRIASALLAHPVKHWSDKFAALTSQLDELEGKPPAVPDMADRDASQDTAADKEPSLALTSESNMVTVRYRNVDEVIVRYYPVDLEFLFSASPFVTQNSGRFASIRPAHSDKIMLPAGADKHTWALPAKFHSDNVLVEVTGGGVTKATAVYANALDVQVSESFGQLTVHHDKTPLPKTYVKVFADVNGAATFYKDGYTDLRGKFDYASLSTDDLNGARRFSILVMSEAHGAVVKEVKPPAR